MTMTMTRSLTGAMAAELTSLRDRVLDAAVVCVDRGGLGRISLEDVAAQASVARATIYRHFPGGRDQLIREAVDREVGRFWRDLAVSVRHLDGIEARLVAGLVEARARLEGHALLQRLLRQEPGDIVSVLAESGPAVYEVLATYLEDLLSIERLRDGVDRREAAEYLARLVVSHISVPGGWDLGDEPAVRRLVRRQFLAGVIDGIEPDR